MNFNDHMTDQQAMLVTLTRSIASNQVAQAYHMARECFDAIVPLPHTNEQGESVVHGCNNAMQATAERWLESARPFLAYLEEDEIEQLRTKYQVCGRLLKNLKKNG
jgi:hypothetical protein